MSWCFVQNSHRQFGAPCLKCKFSLATLVIGGDILTDKLSRFFKILSFTLEFCDVEEISHRQLGASNRIFARNFSKF